MASISERIYFIKLVSENGGLRTRSEIAEAAASGGLQRWRAAVHLGAESMSALGGSRR